MRKKPAKAPIPRTHTKDLGTDVYQAFAADFTSPSAAYEVVTLLVDLMGKALEDGRTLDIRGFGTFRVLPPRGGVIRLPGGEEISAAKPLPRISFRPAMVLRLSIAERGNHG